MKVRLDTLLVTKGFFPSREKAKGAIMAGEVLIDGLVFDKPGMSVPEDAEILVKSEVLPYVSRGGLKLKKALDEFEIDLSDRICLDIGASTGGFTDCMLQHGAKRVFAFDVGYGQLDYKLREDPRVVNLERCNFRYFDNMDSDGNAIVPSDASFASIDVSFISLKHIFPVCAALLSNSDRKDDSEGNDSEIVALVKPQFEAGREQVGKHGLVKDPKVHQEVITKVIEYGKESGLTAHKISFSPITGAKGNIEYLLMLKVNKNTNMEYNIGAQEIDSIVSLAHSSFK